MDDISVSLSGPAVFGVSFDQTDGFTVEGGSSATITATAANGTEPYTYAWTSNLAEADYDAVGAVFTILATALADDYSAEVVATDATSAAVTNSLSFSVVAPTVQYAITVTPSINGTVATDPITEAEAGATVTVNATPDGGYAVDTITVTAADMSNVPVSGTTFTMPAQAVTVAVTFQEASTVGALIISQYYEGTSYNKWIEIYNPGSEAVDLAADGYHLGSWNNADREAWKTGGGATAEVALIGTIPAGGTFLMRHNSATLPAYASADLINSQVCNYNGDDSVVLYMGEPYAFANVVDAFGLTGNTAVDTSFIRRTNVTVGVNTDFNAAEWDEFTLAEVEAAGATVNERLGYHNTGAAVMGVSFDQADDFIVEEGSSATITATAVNGVEPYTYAWTSDLNATFYTALSDTFTIEAAAPVNTYYATVVATDSDSSQVTNTITFSVMALHAITVTPGVNGTVTTTPASEAIQGTTVTITATPDATYAVGTIEVVDSGMNPVAVDGTTFTMPADDVTVTVTFVSDIATLPIAESYTGTHDWTTLPGWSGVSMTTLVDGSMSFNGSGDILTVNFDGTPGEVTFDVKGSTTTVGSAPMQFDLEESVDGAAWTLVVSLTDTDVSTSYAPLGPYTLLATSRYVRWNYVNKFAYNLALNNVAITSGGPAVLGVTLDQTDGFEVNAGNSAVITATAANGTEPYSFAWTSALDEVDYDAVGAVFTIFATTPIGDYSATVTVTDDAMATAEETVTFSVVGLPPSQRIEAITIVAGTGFTFEIPPGSSLERVEGADSEVTGQEFTWTTLAAPTDYEVIGSTVTIKFGGEAQRLIRIWLN